MIRRTTYINITTKSDASMPFKPKHRQDSVNKEDNNNNKEDSNNNENNNSNDHEVIINNDKDMSSSMKRLCEELKRCSQQKTGIMHLRQKVRQRKLNPTPESYYGNDDYEMLSEDSASSDDEKWSNFSDNLNDIETSESEDDEYLENQMSPEPSTRTKVTALVSSQLERPAPVLQSDSVGNTIIFQASEPPKDVSTNSHNIHNIGLQNPDDSVTVEQIQEIKCRFKAIAAAQLQNRRTESQTNSEQLQTTQVTGTPNATPSMTTREQIQKIRNQLKTLVAAKLKTSPAELQNPCMEHPQPIQMAGTPDFTTRTTTREQIRRIKDRIQALEKIQEEKQTTAFQIASVITNPTLIGISKTKPVIESRNDTVKDTVILHNNRQHINAQDSHIKSVDIDRVRIARQDLSLNVPQRSISLQTSHVTNTQALQSSTSQNRGFISSQTPEINRLQVDNVGNLTKTQNSMSCSPATLCLGPEPRMDKSLHINGTQSNDVNRLASTLSLSASPSKASHVSLSPQPVSLKLGTVLPPMKAAILSALAKQKQKDTNGQVPIEIDLKNRSSLSDCSVEKTASQDMEVDAVKESAHPEPTYLCHYCHKELSSPSKLEIHLATKHRHIGGMFKCSYCSDVFFTKEKYARHLTLHGEKTQASCKFCKETFESVDLLVEHIPTHDSKKQHQTELNGSEINGIDEIQPAEDDSESQKKNSERSDGAYEKQPTEQHRSLNDDPKILQSERDSVAVDTHNNVQPTDGIRRDGASGKQPEKQSKIQTKDPEQLKQTVNQTNDSHSTKDKQRNDSHESDATRKMKKCEHCDQSFRHYFAWRLHVKTHNEAKVFSCQLCSKWYLTIRQLSEHVVTHMRDKKPKCEACLLSFRSNQDFQAHKKIDCKNFKFACERRKCYEVFFNFEDYNDHILSHVSDIGTCKFCGLYFGRRYNKLKNHLSAHTGEKPHTCKTCGKTFRTVLSLKIHVLTHDKTKTFKCDECDKTFRQPAALHRHKKTHDINSKSAYRCHMCCKTFTQSCSLQRHLRIHNGERFKCSHCSQTFIEAWRMREHIKKKH